MPSEPGPEIPSPAEATDGAELGEEIGDQVLPGTVEFPPTSPAGIGPAGSYRNAEHHDSVADRANRTVPEEPLPAHDDIVLVESASTGLADNEAQAIGEEVPPVGLLSPEESAMHFEADDVALDEVDQPGED